MSDNTLDVRLPFSRRTFLRLSAATAGALALPGNASANASSGAMTTEYQYVTNHTPASYPVPTLVTFSDAAGPGRMAEAFDAVVTTTEPRPAAYAELTTEEATTAADLPTAETLSHSPGSNPFWRLGSYPLGVFPEPRHSTGFVDFEQMIDGLDHLESEHPSRLDFYALDGDDAADNSRAEVDVDASGRSPGHRNYLTDQVDPKGIYVANPEVLDKGLHQDGEYTFIVESWLTAGAQYEITAEFPQAELTESARSEYDTGGDSDTSTSSAVREASMAPGGEDAVSHTVEADDRHSLTVHVHGTEALYDAALVSPAGEVVREFEAVTEERVGGRCCGNAEWTVKFPAPGEWTVRLTNRLQDAKDAQVRFGTLASTSPHPDPEPALGYEQTPYEVSPFQFFEDLDEFADGPVDPLTVEEASRGRAARLRRYDHVVVIHDDGVDDADYVGALDRFVADGGNLVLADSGVALLGAMETDLAAGVSPDDVDEDRFYVANLAEKDLDHPLLVAQNPPDGEAESVRPIQKQLWKIAPLGYSTSTEAPMTLVDPGAFEDAGGTSSVAATTGGKVSAGSVTRGRTDGTGIHVVGSLLPPANQSNLHPFGLLDYTTSFLGYLVLTNALGFQQVRQTKDGSRRFGCDSFEHPDDSEVPDEGGPLGEATE